MFESFRGTEYGWEVGPSYKDGILRSQIFRLIEGLTRADVDKRWKMEAWGALDGVRPGFRIGTPMDHGAKSLLDWRKLIAISRSAMPQMFALGSHSRATILDYQPSNLQDFNLIWRPKGNYNTDVVSVIEHRHEQEVMNDLLQLVRDKTNGGRFDDAPEDVKLEIIEALEAATQSWGFYIVSQFAWLPRSREPEQIEASEYSEACNRYQTSIAGKKAKRLLLENLTEAQEHDYWQRGYFFVMPHDQDCPLHERRLYVIERGFPNGNILRVKRKQSRGGKWHWYPEHTYCFHTEEPHAVDDILLSQKLMLESEEVEFLKAANVSKPTLDGKAPLDMAKRSV